MTTSAGIVPYEPPSYKGILASQQAGRQALDDPRRADQRHRREQEHTAAQHRHARARWYPAREPGQTLCAVGEERPYHRGSVFCPLCRGLVDASGVADAGLVMDGSVVGRGCVALMLHVVYKGRALPVAWLVRQGKKGHFPEDLHIALVEQVQELIPRVPRWCCWAMANLMAPPPAHGAGVWLVLRGPHGEQHHRRVGRGAPSAAIPWGRVSSRGPSSSYGMCA